jgi:hypothetical protein
MTGDKQRIAEIEALFWAGNDRMMADGACGVVVRSGRRPARLGRRRGGYAVAEVVAHRRGRSLKEDP